MLKAELISSNRELTFKEAWSELNREGLATPFLRVFREYTQGCENTYRSGIQPNDDVWLAGEAYIGGFDTSLVVRKSINLYFEVYPVRGNDNNVVTTLVQGKDPSENQMQFLQASIAVSLVNRLGDRRNIPYYARVTNGGSIELNSPATTLIVDILSKLHRAVLQSRAASGIL